MSSGPSTFGIMITSSLWPIAGTRRTRSSSTQGESRALTRVHSWVSPKSRSEEHTSELQSLMRISYAVFCLKKKKKKQINYKLNNTRMRKQLELERTE